MGLDGIFREGYSRIFKEDGETQNQYLDVLCKVRSMDRSVVDGTNCIFVPNDEYMLNYFGREILNESLGCYFGVNYCVWSNCYLFPVTNLADKVVGFVGFNPINYTKAHDTGDYSITYYSYSKKEVFNKGYYLYFKPGVYEKALKDGYLLLVDGLFDALSLEAAGFNAAASLGSTLTQQILFQLRFIDNIILLADNDAAGIKVYEKLKFHLGNRVHFIKQGLYKDADDVLKSKHREQFIETINSVICGDKNSQFSPILRAYF